MVAAEDVVGDVLRRFLEVALLFTTEHLMRDLDDAVEVVDDDVVTVSAGVPSSFGHADDGVVILGGLQEQKLVVSMLDDPLP